MNRWQVIGMMRWGLRTHLILSGNRTTHLQIAYALDVKIDKLLTWMTARDKCRKIPLQLAKIMTMLSHTPLDGREVLIREGEENAATQSLHNVRT